MKKLLTGRMMVLFVMMLMVAFAAACSSNDDQDDTNEEPEEQTDSESPSGDNADGGISGDLEIQYFVGGYGDTWWKEVIADFKETYPDINILSMLVQILMRKCVAVGCPTIHQMSYILMVRDPVKHKW